MSKYVSIEVPDELVGVEGPPDGVIEIYTDGACSGNPGPCGYGIVMRFAHHYKEISEYLGQGTNNIAELTAIKAALELVKEPAWPVQVYTDSQYSIDMLTKGWNPKKNTALIKEIRALMRGFSRLSLHKVKGHAGHPLNERADTLATSSITRR